MKMNTNDISILIDHICRNDEPVTYGENEITVLKDSKCDRCGKDDDFEPLLSADDFWICVECWSKTYEPISIGLMNKLEEIRKTLKVNEIIRNM